MRKLDRLASAAGDDEDSSDGSSDGEGLKEDREEELKELFIEEELVTISKERMKRNLVACAVENQQGLMWARTAEWTTVNVPAGAIFSPPLPSDGDPAQPAKPSTLVGRMAELGLAYDTTVVLQEKHCFTCGAQMPEETRIVAFPAVLYTDGNCAAPFEVRLLLFSMPASGWARLHLASLHLTLSSAWLCHFMN